VVSTTPRSLCPRKTRPSTHGTGGWMGLKVGWTGAKKFPPPGFFVYIQLYCTITCIIPYTTLSSLLETRLTSPQTNSLYRPHLTQNPSSPPGTHAVAFVYLYATATTRRWSIAAESFFPMSKRPTYPASPAGLSRRMTY
jgi:hypothetical protein